MIKEKNFAMIVQDEANDYKKIKSIAWEVGIRRNVPFSVIGIGINSGYMLYQVDKTYMFEMCRNKKIKMIWKDENLFEIIDFSKNTKGNIICYLEEKDNGGDKIEGYVRHINLKEKYKNKTTMLICKGLLDDKEPFTDEKFCFYKKVV